ncbi:hypothetical protein, partial [Alistipes putredinis]|uniref:hypothetical protein n=1 Tax=Alistipes putredinis TaxID=28117 RepID=UPI003A900105
VGEALSSKSNVRIGDMSEHNATPPIRKQDNGSTTTLRNYLLPPEIKSNQPPTHIHRLTRIPFAYYPFSSSSASAIQVTQLFPQVLTQVKFPQKHPSY